MQEPSDILIEGAWFPEMEVVDRTRSLLIIMGAGVAAAVVLPVMPWAAVVLGIVAIWGFWPLAMGSWRNHWRRRRWRRSFRRWVHPLQMGELVRLNPGGYSLYVREYGALGAPHVPPSALLKQHAPIEWIVVWPPDREVISRALAAEVPVERH